MNIATPGIIVGTLHVGKEVHVRGSTGEVFNWFVGYTLTTGDKDKVHTKTRAAARQYVKNLKSGVSHQGSSGYRYTK